MNKEFSIFTLTQTKSNGESMVVANCLTNLQAECFVEWLEEMYNKDALGELTISEDKVTLDEYIQRLDTTHLSNIAEIEESIKFKRTFKRLNKFSINSERK